MKTDLLLLPFTVSPEVGEFLRRSLSSRSDSAQSPVIQWCERTWIGEEFVGGQVFVGCAANPSLQDASAYDFEGYTVVVPNSSVSVLAGKTIFFETISLTRPSGNKSVRVLRCH